MTPEELLDRAVDVIHERGWCRGSLLDDEGSVCLMGALYDAAGWRIVDGGDVAEHVRNCEAGWDVIQDAVMKVYRTFGLFGYARNGLNVVTRWNDVTAHDADDVIHRLKTARDL